MKLLRYLQLTKILKTASSMFIKVITDSSVSYMLQASWQCCQWLRVPRCHNRCLETEKDLERPYWFYLKFGHWPFLVLCFYEGETENVFHLCCNCKFSTEIMT